MMIVIRNLAEKRLASSLDKICKHVLSRNYFLTPLIISGLDVPFIKVMKFQREKRIRRLDIWHIVKIEEI